MAGMRETRTCHVCNLSSPCRDVVVAHRSDRLLSRTEIQPICVPCEDALDIREDGTESFGMEYRYQERPILWWTDWRELEGHVELELDIDIA